MRTVTLLCGILCLGQIAAAGTLELPNADMEARQGEGLADWQMLEPQAGSPLRDTENPHSGRSCLRLSVVEGRRMVVESAPEGFSLEPCHQYLLRLWVRSSPFLRFSIRLQQLDATGQGYRQQLWPVSNQAIPPAWQQLELPFLTLTTTRRGRLQFVLEGSPTEAGDSYWVDDLQLADLGKAELITTPRRNLWYNGGMELLNREKTMPSGWEGWFESARLLRARVDPDFAHSGAVCLEFPGGERQRVIIVGQAGVRSNLRSPALCRLSVWARGSGTIRFALYQYGPVYYERLLGVSGPDQQVSEEWQEFSLEMAIDNPLTMLVIPTVDCTGTIYLDDAALILLHQPPDSVPVP